MADDAGLPAGRSRLRQLGRALAGRNYRLFFAGQGVSLVGTWMTRLATGWLVLRLAGPDAPWLLGAVSFAGLAPAFPLGPLAGALVDRHRDHGHEGSLVVDAGRGTAIAARRARQYPGPRQDRPDPGRIGSTPPSSPPPGRPDPWGRGGRGVGASRPRTPAPAVASADTHL
jgi:hypothetical protein